MLECSSAHEVDIDFFDQNGYLIVRKALDDKSIAGLIEAGNCLINSNLTENRQHVGESYDGFRNVVTLDDAFISLPPNSGAIAWRQSTCNDISSDLQTP